MGWAFCVDVADVVMLHFRESKDGSADRNTKYLNILCPFHEFPVLGPFLGIRRKKKEKEEKGSLLF